MQRVEHHLATTSTAGGAENAEAAQLLNRCDQLLEHYRDLTTDRIRDTSADRSRGRDRGLEL